MYSKYYLISIFDTLIKVKDNDGNFISLARYVWKYFPDLAKLEDRRVSEIWSGDVNSTPLSLRQKNIINSVQVEKKELASKMNIPLFLLVVLDSNGKVYEIVTKQEVYYDLGLCLSINECSKNSFMEKYNSDYIEGVRKFINRKNFHLIKFPIQKTLMKKK